MRALRYAIEEAAQSLWRGGQAGLLSTLTIALALFVLGGFLVVTANLDRLGSEWSRAAELSVYLKDEATPAERRAIEGTLASSGVVATSEYVSKSDALARFKQTFSDLSNALDTLGGNPLPASIEARLRPGPGTSNAVDALAVRHGRRAAGRRGRPGRAGRARRRVSRAARHIPRAARLGDEHFVGGLSSPRDLHAARGRRHGRRLPRRAGGGLEPLTPYRILTAVLGGGYTGSTSDNPFRGPACHASFPIRGRLARSTRSPSSTGKSSSSINAVCNGSVLLILQAPSPTSKPPSPRSSTRSNNSPRKTTHRSSLVRS